MARHSEEKLQQWREDARPACERLRQDRLKQIIRYAQDRSHGDDEVGLRSLLDQWAAFTFMGNLLQRKRDASPAQRWFNNPCPVSEAPLLDSHADWTSHNARDLMRRAAIDPDRYRKRPKAERPPDNSANELLLDHSVPIIVISAMITDTPDLWSADRMSAFLLRNYRRGLITGCEHKALSKARLAERMPWHWRDGDCPYARYNRAKIDGRERA